MTRAWQERPFGKKENATMETGSERFVLFTQPG